MKKEILLSIAIPTKDRYEPLKSFIKLVESFDSNEVELVIQDNTKDNKEIVQFINEESDPIIKYFHIEEPISMSKNCDEAVKNCEGKYVCLIGDDDFVVKELIDFVRYMDENEIEAARFMAMGGYMWPGVKGFAHPIPKLHVGNFTGKIRRVNIQKELDRVVRCGAIDLKKIPMLYQAVVRKSKLDEVREKNGTCFLGESPDIAIAVALSTVLNNAILCDTPYTVSGKSPKSAGGMGVGHAHNNEIENVPWLSKEAKENWEKEIPAIWTGATIYADTVIKNLRALGLSDKLKRFNYLYSYAHMLLFEKGSIKYINSLVGKDPIKWMKIIWYYIGQFLYRGYMFVKNAAIFRLKWTKTYMNDEIMNTYDASKEVSKLIQAKQYNSYN